MTTQAPEQQDVVLVSALEHFSYCPRQCALIHREQTFDENIYTLRGDLVHERVDEADSQLTLGVRLERGLPIWSESLGLVGRADLVEFHGNVPYPVEYKHGPKRMGRHADLQLCAQAMCLEEMLGVSVPKGAVFHFASRTRREVEFTQVLRQQVWIATAEVRRLLRDDRLPPAPADARCRNCSLIESCMPYVVSRPTRLSSLQTRLFTPLEPQEA
jgi:CRISPR-associated exonuclease Cas4